MRKKHAFTLVELIMVVTIIGMMAIFVIPNYSKSVNKAYEKAATNNLLTIYAAQKNIKNNGGTYLAPADITALNDPNNGLNLSIIGNGMSYDCAAPGGTTFTCTATRDDNSFAVHITDASATVCCSAGTCPSLAGC